MSDEVYKWLGATLLVILITEFERALSARAIRGYMLLREVAFNYLHHKK
jgi:hypothetical protein